MEVGDRVWAVDSSVVYLVEIIEVDDYCIRGPYMYLGSTVRPSPFGNEKSKGPGYFGLDDYTFVPARS